MIQTLCEHTYCRWVDQRAICAVCRKEFDYDYDPNFVGTFVRKDLATSQYILEVTNTTFTIGDYFYPKLD